ncbi:hypothetical protein SEA_DOGFISH_37 [Gordonia phage Dogfish]|nr:hypothetical protein SEA_DOGFISH_37 [Gordonia phage Dogfish]
MIEHILSNVGACYLTVAGIFTGIVLLIDRRHQRRWQPLEIDRGEIVSPGR